MFRAVKQARRHGVHYEYRVYDIGTAPDEILGVNLGLYAANTPTTLVAIPHPSGAEIERPYMLPINGDVNFVMGPVPAVVEVEGDTGYCVPCNGPCREPIRN